MGTVTSILHSTICFVSDQRNNSYGPRNYRVAPLEASKQQSHISLLLPFPNRTV